MLSSCWFPIAAELNTKALCDEIRTVAAGSYKSKDRNGIRGTGYVVESLEAALWCFQNTDNYVDGVLMAANLGEDADTTAAVYGQLAGAYYGFEQIPANWVGLIAMHDTIMEMASALWRRL